MSKDELQLFGTFIQRKAKLLMLRFASQLMKMQDYLDDGRIDSWI